MPVLQYEQSNQAQPTARQTNITQESPSKAEPEYNSSIAQME